MSFQLTVTETCGLVHTDVEADSSVLTTCMNEF